MFIKNDIPVTERAYLLGHSVDTNLKYYSPTTEPTTDEILDKLNGVTPNSPRNVVDFKDYTKKEEPLKRLN